MTKVYQNYIHNSITIIGRTKVGLINLVSTEKQFISITHSTVSIETMSFLFSTIKSVPRQLGIQWYSIIIDIGFQDEQISGIVNFKILQHMLQNLFCLFVLFLKQGLIQPRLVSNSKCSQGEPEFLLLPSSTCDYKDVATTPGSELVFKNLTEKEEEQICLVQWNFFKGVSTGI